MSEPHMTFTWHEPHRSSWTLAGLIFFTLFLHCSAFFLLQAAFPPRSTPPRTAQPVQFLTPFTPDGQPSPENAALLAWVATADPALSARVPSVEPKGLLDVPYIPSYLTLRTPPQGLPAESASIQFPTARDPMSLILGTAITAKPADIPIAPQQTSFSFSPTLTRRAPASAAFMPAAKTTTPLQPTSLLLGVTDQGETRYTFTQQSSGSPALDAEAAAFARSLPFAAAVQPITWGTITIAWGDETAATATP